MCPTDQHHYYYRDDAPAMPPQRNEQVSRSLVTVTSAADDSSLSDADPDHPQSWWSIKPVAGLPVITNKVVINGYSQPATRRNDMTECDNAVLRIELDGSGLRIGDYG